MLKNVVWLFQMTFKPRCSFLFQENKERQRQKKNSKWAKVETADGGRGPLPEEWPADLERFWELVKMHIPRPPSTHPVSQSLMITPRNLHFKRFPGVSCAQ